MGGDLPAAEILSTKSVWRCGFVWQTELIENGTGTLAPFIKGAKGAVTKETSPALPANWADASFDDSDWAPAPGPIAMAPQRHDLAAICLRGRFEVDNPATAGELSFTLRYRGGAMVLLNGKEIARADLPDGEIALDTPAKSYPRETYVDGAGKMLASPPALTRSLEIGLPAAGLRKGVNVLAVALHRSPTSALYYDAPAATKNGRRASWSLLGFEGATLLAAEGSSADAVVARPGRPLVWAANPVVDVWDCESGDRSAASPVVTIAGARNGAFSGVVCVQCAESVQTVAVRAGDLKNGDAAIPSAACQLRYAIPGDTPPRGGAGRHSPKAVFLGALADDPPKGVALPAANAPVTIPVWLTVRVPRDARPGDYRGSLAVSVNGGADVTVPVALSVADYALPEVRDFHSYPDLVQSPESVALRYNVPLWSEEHWRLLEKTFALLAQVGGKEVIIPLIGRTNMGNEHSMVRWIRQADGTYTNDFSVAERYLDLAIKHLGKVPVVILYVWTPTHGGGGFGAIVDKPKNDVPMVFSVFDPATREMKLANGPDWGTPESKPFWKPAITGMRKILAARAMEKSVAFGLANDRVPSKAALADLDDCGADIPWVMYAHGRCNALAGRPLAIDNCVWGQRGPIQIGEPFHVFAWKNRVPTTVFPRFGAGILNHVQSDSPLGIYQVQIEAYTASGYNGVGNVGADFWPVIRDRKGVLGGRVYHRFVTWQRPGEPSLSNAAYLFPGENGPLATVRFELFRQGVQETEARIAIERALDDKARVARLGAELAGVARKLLNERARRIIRARDDTGEGAGWADFAGGWQGRNAALYGLAGEVLRKTGE
jgi:hypothetical protein